MNRNYEELRNLIIKILGDELGFYTLPNKMKVPSITVKQPIPYPEPGTIQSGLEVVIFPEAGFDIENYLGSSLITEEIRLILNQWDSKRDTNKATALIVKNIQPLWEIKRIGPTVMPNWDLETVESRVIYLNSVNSHRWTRNS